MYQLSLVLLTPVLSPSVFKVCFCFFFSRSVSSKLFWNTSRFSSPWRRFHRTVRLHPVLDSLSFSFLRVHIILRLSIIIT